MKRTALYVVSTKNGLKMAFHTGKEGQAFGAKNGGVESQHWIVVPDQGCYGKIYFVCKWKQTGGVHVARGFLTKREGERFMMEASNEMGFSFTFGWVSVVDKDLKMGKRIVQKEGEESSHT